VTNQGVRIYYEVEGQGPPLVLMHGTGTSRKLWRAFGSRALGYVKELRTDYQLIVVDARGHGDSEKPYDIQSYSPEFMTGDIVARARGKIWSTNIRMANTSPRPDRG
jgi:pimeloyl-ACP methyl ester carboxylesterase